MNIWMSRFRGLPETIAATYPPFTNVSNRLTNTMFETQRRLYGQKRRKRLQRKVVFIVTKPIINGSTSLRSRSTSRTNGNRRSDANNLYFTGGD